MVETNEGAAPPDLPWDKTPVPGWREAVESWPWQSIGRGDWEKSGHCLRCGHGITVEKEGSYSATITMSEDAELAILIQAEDGPLRVTVEDEELFFARCDCGEKHPGRPPQITRGCGQWGMIAPPPADE